MQKKRTIRVKENRKEYCNKKNIYTMSKCQWCGREFDAFQSPSYDYCSAKCKHEAEQAGR